MPFLYPTICACLSAERLAAGGLRRPCECECEGGVATSYLSYLLTLLICFSDNISASAFPPAWLCASLCVCACVCACVSGCVSCVHLPIRF
mmetsp:Transcript_7781/g.19124  ORF Transcript_7781/g.19124 Transcript_7781/m.19124 type:complete len:91 (+) Transcript_7781:1695-1967(+)